MKSKKKKKKKFCKFYTFWVIGTLIFMDELLSTKNLWSEPSSTVPMSILLLSEEEIVLSSRNGWS